MRLLTAPSALMLTITLLCGSTGAAEPKHRPVAAAPRPTGPTRTIFGLETLNSELARTERLLGAAPGIRSFFVPDGAQIPLTRMVGIRKQGSIPMIVWQPTGTFDSVARGDQDRSVIRAAEALSRYGHPVFLRLWPEMNTTWERYSVRPARTGYGAAAFVAAWRRVFTLLRRHGGPDILTTWNVGYSGTSRNLASLWPGASYVNYIAVDAYDWCVKPTWCPGARYRYLPMLRTIRRFAGRRVPALLGEVGTGSTVGKGAWVSALMSHASADGIHAVVYFDQTSPLKEPDWRLRNASPAQSALLRKALDQGPVVTSDRFPVARIEAYALHGYWT